MNSADDDLKDVLEKLRNARSNVVSAKGMSALADLDRAIQIIKALRAALLRA